ncbi:MAG: hypothetical protein WC681_14285 [Sterolibacterium sp.]
MDDVDFSYLWDKRHETLYRVELSILYHKKRERFFEVCDKLAKAIAVIGGSAAFAQLGGAEVMAYVGAGIVATSTLSLVFGLSDRSRRHAELAMNFRQIEAEIVARGERDFTETEVSVWASKVRMLESSEPAALGALVTICQNELAIAQGQPNKIVTVPLMHRALAHLIDYSPPHQPA